MRLLRGESSVTIILLCCCTYLFHCYSKDLLLHLLVLVCTVRTAYFNETLRSRLLPCLAIKSPPSQTRVTRALEVRNSFRRVL